MIPPPRFRYKRTRQQQLHERKHATFESHHRQHSTLNDRVFPSFPTKHLPIFFLILLMLFSMCKAPYQYGNDLSPPLIKVGIMEDLEAVEFLVSGQTTFEHRTRKVPVPKTEAGRWRVEIKRSTPAKIEYWLSVGTTSDRSRAYEIARFMKKKGLKTRLESRRRTSGWALPYLPQSIHYVFLDKTFRTEEAARTYQASIRQKTGSELVEVPVVQATGLLRFTNLETKYSFESANPVRVNATDVELLEVEVGVGFHWEARENRKYRGSLQFMIDRFGAITVVNEVSLEEYLMGVVPSEMPVGFPFEALKAQAVAARVEAAAKIDVRHPFQPFDLCDDVHCQVYSGLSKLAESTNRAIKSTRGIFIAHRSKIIEAFYSGVCGGHTENNDNVWLTDAKPYLRGIRDAAGGDSWTALHDEARIQRWIDRRPNVFCNTTSKKVPEFLNYSKKYFRWEVTYPRTDLEKILRNKTGVDFGDLLDLIPRKRGVSGRVIELEVVGSQRRFTIDKEFSIRQALSENTLFSSCFYVRKIGSTKRPTRFVLRGAGWGHGVGMCQVGAAVMAYSGRSFDQILKHYYRKISLQLLYN